MATPGEARISRDREATFTTEWRVAGGSLAALQAVLGHGTIAVTERYGGKRRVSATGGRQPRWRADGRELYYIGPGELILAVRVSPGAQLETGAPVTLFRAPGVANYDVTADGLQFLVGIPTDPDRESQIHVIVNWAAALKREN